MHKLRREDWLPQAQRLAVGRSDRIEHKGDGSRRKNLIVSHTAEGWTAHCFACNVGDGVRKSHIKLSERAPKASTELAPPNDIQWDTELPMWLRERLEGFLLSKGINGAWLPPWGYSKHRERILIQPELWPRGTYLARDITGDSNIKWIAYGIRGKPWVIEPTFPDRVYAKNGTLYLTEDLFSMYKVQWALQLYEAGMAAVSTFVGTTLGTTIVPSQLAAIAKMGYQRIVVFYDGDKAGLEGSKVVGHRLRALLPETQVLSLVAPEGLDPKDMEGREILDYLKQAGGLPI